MNRATLKEMSELHKRIEQTLERGSPDGMRVSEICEELKLTPNQATKQRIKRQLSSLLRDRESPVYAHKKGKNYDDEALLPAGTSPVKWHIKKNPSKLSHESEMIALVTAIKYARFFLPPDQREWIEDRYEHISKTTKDDQKWFDKVRVEPRYPPIYPNMGKGYGAKETVIYDALRSNRAFEAHYDNGKSLCYYPVRLLRREQVQYVVCTLSLEEPLFTEYAIHRFSRVATSTRKLPRKLATKEAFDKYHQPSVPGPWKRYKKLRIQLKGPAINHFSNMRFHEDENNHAHLTSIKRSCVNTETGQQNYIEIKISDISYTYEMRTWLLGLGRNAVVLGPREINEDIVNEVAAMAKHYGLI